jgi:hypothetical protein
MESSLEDEHHSAVIGNHSSSKQLSLDSILLRMNSLQFPHTKRHHLVSKTGQIAILSMYEGSAKEFAPYTKQNRLQYAKRHGYHFIDAAEDVELVKLRQRDDVMGNLQLSKIALVHAVLKRGKYRWVMWCDADAVFLNHSRSLRDAGLLEERFDLVLAT